MRHLTWRTDRMRGPRLGPGRQAWSIKLPERTERSNEMLGWMRVQLWKAENGIPVDGTRGARHCGVVPRLVDVAAIRFVSHASASHVNRLV